MYTIYKRTTPDGRVYIGKTQNTLEHRAGPNGCRYYGCKRFYNAILKYGWMNIFSEILYRTESYEEAAQKEQFFIRKYDSTNPKKGYNQNAMAKKSVNEEPKDDQSSCKTMTFGQKVRKYREERGLSVTELAKIANLAQPTVSQFESGARKNPYPNTKIAIAMALGVKPSELDDDREEDTNGGETDNPG